MWTTQSPSVLWCRIVVSKTLVARPKLHTKWVSDRHTEPRSVNRRDANERSTQLFPGIRPNVPAVYTLRTVSRTPDHTSKVLGGTGRWTLRFTHSPDPESGVPKGCGRRGNRCWCRGMNPTHGTPVPPLLRPVQGSLPICYGSHRTISRGPLRVADPTLETNLVGKEKVVVDLLRRQ